MPQKFLDYTENEVLSLIAADARKHTNGSVTRADVSAMHGGYRVKVRDGAAPAKGEEPKELVNKPAPRTRGKKL